MRETEHVYVKMPRVCLEAAYRSGDTISISFAAGKLETVDAIEFAAVLPLLRRAWRDGPRYASEWGPLALTDAQRAAVEAP